MVVAVLFIFLTIAIAAFSTTIITGETTISMLTLCFIIAAFVYLFTLIDIRIGIVVLIISIGVSPEFEIFGIENIRLEDFIMPILLISWLARALSKREDLQPALLKTPILTYILIAILSSLFGISFAKTPPLRTLFIFGKTIEYFMMFFLILNNTRSIRDVKLYVYTMLIAGTITALMGINEYRAGKEMFAETKVSGPHGEGSNILGGYLVINMALIVGLLFRASSIQSVFLYVIMFGIISFPFLYTLSRTSYVAITGGIFLLGVLKEPRVLIFLLFVLILLPLILPLGVAERIESIGGIFTDKPPSSWEARVVGWRSFGRKVFDYPLIGRGVGAIGFADVDNEYLRQVIELGIVGLLVFLWILFTLFRMAYKAFVICKGNRFLEGLALGYLAIICTLSIHAFGSTCFSTIRTMEPLMVISGIVQAVLNNYELWKKEERGEFRTDEMEEFIMRERKAVHTQL